MSWSLISPWPNGKAGFGLLATELTAGERHMKRGPLPLPRRTAFATSGCRLVWVIDPRTRTVAVYTSLGITIVLHDGTVQRSQPTLREMPSAGPVDAEILTAGRGNGFTRNALRRAKERLGTGRAATDADRDRASTGSSNAQVHLHPTTA